MKRQTAISQTTIKRLFALSRNQCAFPNCPTAIVQPSLTLTGKICHIRARNPGGLRYDPTQTDAERNGFENLILLCSVHHDIVDDKDRVKTYTVELLEEMKEMHERNGTMEVSKEDEQFVSRLIDAYVHVEASGDAQVMIGSPGGIQAKHVTIKTGRKTPPKIQPLDSIGANSEMRAYVGYLVKRYIEWRTDGINSGKDRRRFHPSMVHRWIERDFGTSTYFVLQSRFEGLVEYLQRMIDDTILGRIRRSRGERNYHSFEEHVRKLRGD